MTLLKFLDVGLHACLNSLFVDILHNGLISLMNFGVFVELKHEPVVLVELDI